MVAQRSLAQRFLALQALLTAGLALLLLFRQDPRAWGVSGGAIVYIGCWLAFRRGWEPARPVAVVVITLLLIATTREPHLTERPALAVLIPPVVA